MPRPHPPEFRQRAVELAQLREQPMGKIAADLGISESCLRRWVRLAEGDAATVGGRSGQGAGGVLDAGERAELIALRRKTRVQAMEIDILRRASAYFARESLPDPK
ncbi:transposase [Kineococcus glutinatus]|uniref:Transposase n=1 Tax=Kineococcus glutinatus TaxID=1070872 RepID=A0ABP9I4D1_9ACTN